MNEENAIVTYEKVCKAYEKIFSRLELPIIKSKLVLLISNAHFSNSVLLLS